MNKPFLSFFILFFVLPSFGLAQNTDTKLWTGFVIEKKISKKIGGSLELEQRFYNNISSFDRFLIEPAVSYKLNKKWSVDLIYRLWYRQTIEQNYFFHSRASLGLNYAKEIKDFRIKLNSKLQYGLPDRIEDDFYATKKLVSRNSIKLSYKIFGSRFTPYFKYELFTSLDRLNPQNYQWRMIGGTRIYITSNNSIKLFYMLEHEYNVVNRINANIWGILLQHSL